MKWKLVAVLALCAAAMLMTRPAAAYTYCGAHDRRYEMRAYFFNSEFWVDLLAAQERKWNLVHPVLSINREKSSTVPASLGDGQNVISWLAEADLLRIYNRTWGQALAVTFIRKEKNCGRMLESDVIFNPAITQFTPQTDVPYSIGFQEAALHELGHVLTLGHEDGSLSLMATAPKVSDVLHHNEKVGWNRSASQRFNPLPHPIRDMGVFPLRKGRGFEIYSSLSPSTVSRGGDVTISDFSVENLSAQVPFSQPGPKFRVLLENVASGAATEIGSFSWESFEPFSGWSGDLTYTVPAGMPRATYRVVAEFTGQDEDTSNDRAVFGTIDVQ